IKVVTENGEVFLLGLVSRAQADLAVDIARNTSGVRKVIKVFEYTDAAK
ncbi:BON domain-containing protein, partial [Shewanella sp. A25]|nr:BON domain-containing protein [Shewanella shenzhenensis]